MNNETAWALFIAGAGTTLSACFFYVLAKNYHALETLDKLREIKIEAQEINNTLKALQRQTQQEQFVSEYIQLTTSPSDNLSSVKLNPWTWSHFFQTPHTLEQKIKKMEDEINGLQTENARLNQKIDDDIDNQDALVNRRAIEQDIFARPNGNNTY